MINEKLKIKYKLKNKACTTHNLRTIKGAINPDWLDHTYNKNIQNTHFKILNTTETLCVENCESLWVQDSL